jgi:hypothetical protein
VNAQKQREAEKVTRAYQIALTQLGVKTTVQAIKLWDHMPPNARAAQAQTWLRAAVQLIMGRRTESVELARAYYRLARALITGTTVANPNKPEPQYITLDVLRSEFATLAGPQSGYEAPKTRAANDVSNKPGGGAHNEPGPHENDPEDDVLVEEIAKLKEQEANAQAEAEQEMRLILQQLGANAQASAVSKIDQEAKRAEQSGKPRTSTEVDKARNDAHTQAGARQASAASRMAMNGGRTTSWLLQENDKRAIGYVRVSLTGTPCGWCAMLISRGPVYKSAASATLSRGAAEYTDGDRYHDNCHCIAVPVYSQDQFNNSPKFALNRTYAEQWPQVTRGLGGSSAVSAWRRFIRTQQASQTKTRRAA